VEQIAAAFRAGLAGKTVAWRSRAVVVAAVHRDA
jgi:hypothetical protein